MSSPINILHLSDIQFGKNHRFGQLAIDEGPNADFETLFTRLTDDLRTIKVKIDVIALTGDLAEWGQKQEFEDAERFLIALADKLKVARNRIAVIPGNHDINRKLCEAYFAQCEGESETPQAPFWPKWKHYNSLVERFYRDVPGFHFSEEQPWSLLEIPELKIVIAGLNSTLSESHLETSHYGFVGEAQLRWFADKLQAYQAKQWLNLSRTSQL